jgi:hypothetical protein
MKNLKQIIMKTKAIKLTAVLMILTVSVFAAGNFGGTKSANDKNSIRANVYPVSREMVEIRVAKPAEDVVNLEVYNEAGSKVYETIIKNGMNIRVSHDIKEFPAGLYTYKISEDGKLIHSSMILKTRETILKCSPENDHATAYISQSGSNKVEVNFIQVPGTETRVEARDQAGNVVLSRLLNDEKAHRFTENISAYPSGQFIFTVYAGDERIAEKSIVKK